MIDTLELNKKMGTLRDIEKIGAGIPQGSILGSILYLLYTAALPTDVNYQTATFADDTAILAVGNTTY